MNAVEMMESITRFRCEGCLKTVDRKGVDDGKMRPPDSWRFLTCEVFRVRDETDRNKVVSGLVCGPGCASKIAMSAWPPEVSEPS